MAIVETLEEPLEGPASFPIALRCRQPLLRPRNGGVEIDAAILRQPRGWNVTQPPALRA